MCGEIVSSDEGAFENFKIEFQLLLHSKGLTDEQIYNADESALFPWLVPTKTLATMEEKFATGRKQDKRRITFMPCANMTGSNKLPLVVIGKQARPRCFPRDISGLPGNLRLVHIRVSRHIGFETLLKLYF